MVTDLIKILAEADKIIDHLNNHNSTLAKVQQGLTDIDQLIENKKSIEIKES